MYVQLLHLKWKFLKGLHACLSPYANLNISVTFWPDHLWRHFCHWLQIFNQRVSMHNSAYISNKNSSKLSIGAVVVWSYGSWIYNYLCNQCLFTTKVVRSNPVHGEVYSMQQYVIKIVSDLRKKIEKSVLLMSCNGLSLSVIIFCPLA